MRNAIIVGASIENLGAESMTCIAIERAYCINPKFNIIIASTDKKGMQIKVKPRVIDNSFPTVTAFHQGLFGLLVRRYLGLYGNKNIEHLLSRTDVIIDVSGYAFTTKFGLSGMWSILNRIYLAKKNGIRYLMLSQSFGPEKINNIFDKIVIDLVSLFLFKYPEIVEARERSGFNFMKLRCGKNLVYRPDMVLLYPAQIKYSFLRKEICDIGLQNIPDKCVALIPNQKIIEKTADSSDYMAILKKIAKQLLSMGYNVHIIVHCKLDMKICNSLASDNSQLLLIDLTNYGGYAYDLLIRNYCFVIASRFHSIVHAYRNGIPAVAIGWEDKYNELLMLMDQSEYMIDWRKHYKESQILEKVCDVEKKYKVLSKCILIKLAELRAKYA